MGTNFYWHDRPCEHCNRYEEIHVGKNSGGWSFGFRAWPHRLQNENYPEWGYEPASPFGFPVESRADWRKIFTERPGELFDEYSRRVDDPVAWLDGLTPPDLAQRRKEDSPAWRGPYSGIDSRDSRDAEGFRFYAGEFS